MAAMFRAFQQAQRLSRAPALCWDAAPLRELAAFLSPSCPYHSRHCSTSSGQDSSATPPDYVPPEGARAIKKHGVLVKGGPRTMIREDVLDMFARHNLQVPPEAVTPFYQRRPGDGFIQHGWAVQLFSAAEVAAALRSSKDKVGGQRVSVSEYSMKETHLSVLQTALRSSGRFLLVQNIPSSATRRDMTGMFRGFRLLEGDSVGPVFMVDDPPPSDRDGRGGRGQRHPREQRDRRGGRGGRWDQGSEPPVPRAAIVKFCNPEDAHAAWRLRHGRRYRFGHSDDGPTPLLSCKILE